MVVVGDDDDDDGDMELITDLVRIRIIIIPFPCVSAKCCFYAGGEGGSESLLC